MINDDNVLAKLKTKDDVNKVLCNGKFNNDKLSKLYNKIVLPFDLVNYINLLNKFASTKTEIIIQHIDNEFNINIFSTYPLDQTLQNLLIHLSKTNIKCHSIKKTFSLRGTQKSSFSAELIHSQTVGMLRY